MRRKTKNRRIRKVLFLMIVIIICVAIFFLPSVFSKYVIQTEEVYVQQAVNFYFESDIENKTYSLNDWDIEEDYTISFNITNYENSLLYTSSDITYEIEIDVLDEQGESTNAISALVKNSNNNEVSGSETLTGGTLSENTYNLIVSSNSANSGDTFTVIITLLSTSPYSKTITGTVYLTAEEDSEPYVISLTELDEKEYDILTITTYEIDEDVIFTYDNTKYTLDASAEILQGASIVENDGTTTVTISNENFENYGNYKVYLIKIT